MKKTVKKFITLLCAVLLLSTSAIFSFPSTASENESNAESKIMLQKEHSYGEWYVVVHPTETEFGLSRRDCSECDAYETKTIAKLSDAKLTDTHNFSGKEEIITPASCTADGSKKVYCTEDGCGAYRIVTVEKTGHVEIWGDEIKPTCRHPGARLKKCSICGVTLGMESIPELPHDYKTVSIVPPTSIEKGYTLYKCKVCGYENKGNFMAPVPEDATKIVVKTKRGFAGKTVLVNVILENNPGIWGMDLAVSYDKTNLTLNSVINGDVFADSEWTKGNLSAESYILSYEANGFENVSGSGVLATLEFTVNDEAQAEDFYEISVSYRSGDIIDAAFAEISPAVVQGGVQVIDVLYGDLNGDGIVNKKDSLLMKMYLADNTTQINEAAADVFPDGAINKKDSLYLKQYLAGLDVELGA